MGGLFPTQGTTRLSSPAPRVEAKRKREWQPSQLPNERQAESRRSGPQLDEIVSAVRPPIRHAGGRDNFTNEAVLFAPREAEIFRSIPMKMVHQTSRCVLAVATNC